MKISFSTPNTDHQRSKPSIVDLESVVMVAPGEVITDEPGFMRGHGTYSIEDKTIATTSGSVERVNKLISVRPLRARYAGDIGDVVIGRITEVAQKKWKVDIHGRQDGVLFLSSINLPGGVQRRKTELDELNMRTFFAEGDLICAEIQSVFSDGTVSIHTRNARYGKLRNGCLVTIPSVLVKRMQSHFHTLPFGIDLVLGMNGNVWVSKHVPQSDDSENMYSSKNEQINDEVRDSIARVCNCVKALAKDYNLHITDSLIKTAYEATLSKPANDILTPEGFETILKAVSK